MVESPATSELNDDGFPALGSYDLHKHEDLKLDIFETIEELLRASCQK